MDLSFSPSPPEAPRYDSGLRVWTLSRYADVHAALREPTFCQVSARGPSTGSVDPIALSQMHAELQADIDRMSTEVWRERMVNIAHTLMNQAADRMSVNIVDHVIQPWSTAVMLSLSDADRALEARLSSIADLLFHKRENDGGLLIEKEPRPTLIKKWFKWRRKNAEADLDRMRDSGQITISKSMFFGVSQTLPSFLAKSWLALLLHPDQLEMLRTEPDWMPYAVEELLRYAGIVHTLYRQATKDVVLGDAHIAKNERIILKMESANRDPIKFDSPDRLDITRRPTGNLGLGAGPYACSGAVIVRKALSLVTPAFLAGHPILDEGSPILWTGDTSIRRPLAVFVRLWKQSVEVRDHPHIGKLGL
jgi:cytochrome P450